MEFIFICHFKTLFNQQTTEFLTFLISLEGKHLNFRTILIRQRNLRSIDFLSASSLFFQEDFLTNYP